MGLWRTEQKLAGGRVYPSLVQFGLDDARLESEQRCMYPHLIHVFLASHDVGHHAVQVYPVGGRGKLKYAAEISR